MLNPPLFLNLGGSVANCTANLFDFKVCNRYMSKASQSRPSSLARKHTGKAKKYIFAFGSKTDGNAGMRELLGGKGANLAEMASIGLPVPPGFTISTEVCTYYYDHEMRYPTALKKDVVTALKQEETQLG